MLIHPLTIALVAGESSGDILGAGLIHALKNRYPYTRFVGIAGPLMQSEGCETWYKMEDLSVIGIIEVLENFLHLLKIRYELTERLIKLKPDVFIGIDSPDFNIPLEGNLKRSGIPTIHYVSPSVWAWRKNRIFKIRKNTNLILLLFSFEKSFYEFFNVPYHFIGHTIADVIPLQSDKYAARFELGINKESLCLSLLPGSRKVEIEMLSADFLCAAQLLHREHPTLEILVPLVNAKCKSVFKEIKRKIAPELPIRLFHSKSRKVLTASDGAIIASGTATLEGMLAKCPMVVAYRMRNFNFWIARYLVKTPYFSLPNLLAGKEIIREFLQNKCHPLALASAIEPFLHSSSQRESLLKIFNKLHQNIRCNANEKAADAVLKVING